MALELTAAQRRFAHHAIRRGRVFLTLAVSGVAAAILLGAYYAVRRLGDPDYPIALRAVLVVLVLLNARQNLRQYRYAGVLRRLLNEGETERKSRSRDES